MVRFFFTSLLFVGVVSSCAPRQQVPLGVTVTPVLIKLSEPAARGGTLTIQGRYLGGPASGKVRLGADASGAGGYLFPASAVRAWTDREIVLTLPSDAPIGGSWLFVEVGGRQSTGLPYSVRQ